MTEYISAKEIAQIKVQGMPKSVKGIIDKAKRERWDCQKRKGRGGGLEYRIDSLPAEIQAAIQARRVRQVLAAAQAQVPAADAGFAAAYPEVKAGSAAARRLVSQKLPPAEMERGLNDKQRKTANARLILARQVLRLRDEAGLTLTEAVRRFVADAQDGRLPEETMQRIADANARGNENRVLGVRTLHGWVNTCQNTGRQEVVAALAPKIRPKRDLPAIEWLPDFLSCYCLPNKPTLAAAYRDFCTRRGAAGAFVPKIDAVKRAFSRLPVIVQERARNTGAAYTALLPYVARDWLKCAPNSVWVGDGHSFKAKVRHPMHGQPFKPEVTVIMDCLRYVVGFSVSLAESATAVADALRISMKHNGIPLIYYSDNGGGQTAKMLDAGTLGMFSRLGIRHETGIPGNPQARGLIERWWAHLIDLAKTYPTYVGKDADSSTKNLMYRQMESAFKAQNKGTELTKAQKEIIGKVPTWQQFIADVARTIEAYNHTPHSSLPKKGDGTHYCPAEYRAMRLEAENLVPDMPTAYELETMMQPEEVRKTARGLVQLFNQSYFSADLAMYHGQDVRVRYDISDWQSVRIFTMDGTFICVAEFEGNKRAAMPQTYVEQAQRKRTERRVALLKEKAALAEAENRTEVVQPDFGRLLEQDRRTGRVEVPEIGSLIACKPKKARKYRVLPSD